MIHPLVPCSFQGYPVPGPMSLLGRCPHPVSNKGVPPSSLWQGIPHLLLDGGTLARSGRTGLHSDRDRAAHRVLATRRAVYLLHSGRRTFLLRTKLTWFHKRLTRFPPFCRVIQEALWCAKMGRTGCRQELRHMGLNHTVWHLMCTSASPRTYHGSNTRHR